jgi:hypothetical protein
VQFLSTAKEKMIAAQDGAEAQGRTQPGVTHRLTCTMSWSWRITEATPSDLGNSSYFGVGGFRHLLLIFKPRNGMMILADEHASWLIGCQHGCWFVSHIVGPSWLWNSCC